jgi:hypothetical protein
MPQINEERLAQALVSHGVSLADAQVIAAEAATASAAVITPAPASAPAVAASVAPLTKAERKEVFVEQRAAELTAAGKPVNTVALEKKFDELAKTTEGRAQITTVVQRAEPAVLQAIGPAEVPAALLPAGLGAPAAPTTAARTITTPQNVRPEELARGLFTEETSTPGFTSVGPTPQPVTPQEAPAPVSVEQPPAQQGASTTPPNVRPEELARGLFPGYVGEAENISPIGAGGGPAGGGPAGGGPAGGGPTTGGATGATGADGQDDGGETPEERQTRLANEREAAREEADRVRRGRDARSTMAAVLNTYGLGELTEYVYDLIARETVNINNPDAIIFAIREQPAYQRRFAGNAARLRAGLSELSPAEYIGLENQFRQTLRSNGLPANFYDQPDDFKSFIEGDVSNSELNERVQQGYRAVADADPAVKEQMRNLYGVSEGQLAAYFLDPQRTAPLLTRQAQAANIAARGLEQGGMQLTGQFAEDLARRGITEQQARAGFAEVGGLGELKQTFAGETALSDEQLAGAAFGIDVAAQQELERKRRMRTAEFAGGGSFARTTGETSGSISTSVGKAQ